MPIARLPTLAFLVAAATAIAATLAGAPVLAQGKQASPGKPSKAAATIEHKVAIQVNQNDKAVMELALNNAKNIAEYFKAKNQDVKIELVAYGPGLHMLRSDTSPVKERISVMSLENPNMTFAACGNTQANQAKAENKPVTLLSEAKVTPSGVVRLMELQKQGYAYIRP
jgi:intracellular sulfur oxidation DsrE/DsrF family protein